MDATNNQFTAPYCSREVVLIWALPVLTLLMVLTLIRLISAKKRYAPIMDSRSNQLTDPYCSTSSSASPLWDVFLSFYGKDTRRNFVANLYFALDQAGILTFRDDPALPKGEEISSGLVNAIKDSKMFVVVISENYARSPWCLNELVEILGCNRKKIQVVPVFYYVDPSDLRHLKGSFGEAFGLHEKRHSVKTIGKWRSALVDIAELSGYHLKKDANENEADTIQEIVANVAAQTFTKLLHIDEYLLGIDSVVEEIYRRLSMDSNDIRAIGILGMGGIGKTTTAKAFYNKYCNKFHISCFIDNIKQYSQKSSPLLDILEKLLIELLGRRDYKATNLESGIRQLKKILCHKKALIVLDDLDQSSYLSLLSRLCNLFSPGSRIMITTRDENLLKQLQVDISNVYIYRVKVLGEKDSLELFSYYAFRKIMPPENFRELSIKFAKSAGGLPLALKVLGSSLRGRTDVSFWKAKLEKVKVIPQNETHQILRLTYDELGDETVKSIFLDIAFFFVGEDKTEAVHVFESCHFFPDEGIPILVDRCLLTIDEDNKFEMHNLIQEMGREIGKTRRTHLFLRGNAWKDSQNLEGSHNIEGLVLNLTAFTNRGMNTLLFEGMSNLRLLQIIGAHDLKGNFKNLFPQLRCIRWHYSSWTHIPSTFRPQNLVSIDMRSSKLKILWKDPKSIKQLNNLYCLNMSGCRDFKRLPEQLGEMKGLKMIDVSRTAIQKLPDSITHLKELADLKLNSCEKLTKLPVHIGNMESLRIFDASETAIEQLPDSFVGLINLVQLSLYKCVNLRNLPDSIWQLKLLEELQLNQCSKLERLPEQLGEMQCLEFLYAHGTAIEQVPDSIRLLSRLKAVTFTGCKKLKYVPESIWNLTSIEYLHLQRGIMSLPNSVEHLNNLKSLDLSCNVRLCLPMILLFPCLELLSLTDEGQILSSAEPVVSLSQLINLKYLGLKKCTSLGSSLPELPSNLGTLDLRDHNSLEELADLSSLKLLERLYIQRCISLKSISSLPPHLKLLSVEECTSLQDLPDLSLSKELVCLDVIQCNNLKSISLKQSSFQVGQDHFSSFKAILPNREVAEWFDYKSRGHTVSFEIPASSGSNFLGLALWVVYTCKTTDEHTTYIRAVITSSTESITEDCKIYVHIVGSGEAQSGVQCITGEEMPMKSGDRIKVSFSSLMYYDDYNKFEEFPNGEVKVKMCGVHIMQDKPSTSVY